MHRMRGLCEEAASFVRNASFLPPLVASGREGPLKLKKNKCSAAWRTRTQMPWLRLGRWRPVTIEASAPPPPSE